MGVVLRDPVWMVLAALAVPLAVVGLRWFRAMSRARAISAVVARTILILLIAAALAGASGVRTSDRLAVIAVIDVSGSVQRFGDFGRDERGVPRSFTQAARSWLARASDGRDREDLLGVVVFDGRSLAIASPAPPAANRRSDGLLGWTPDDLALDLALAEGTDIADALRYAAALFPPDARRRLVLISDGVETRGDALAAARALAEAPGAAVPVDVLPISYNVRNEVLVEFVDAPPTASRESMVAVRVGLRATAPAAGTLRLEREGGELDISPDEPGLGLRLALEPGRTVVPIEVRVPAQTVHRFRAVFEPDDPAADTVAQNNSGMAFTVTPGRGKTLVIDGVSDGATTGPGSILPGALTRSGLEVSAVPPGAAPMDLLTLQEYDLVILQDVPADALPRNVQEIYASYVRDLGGGLVMVGGPNSFGAGGWNNGPIEDVLPVEMDLPEQLLMPSAAIVLVLDSSGSMGARVLGGARTQQEIANEAAALAVRTLDPTDLVGVIEFNSTHRTVVPLGPNRDPEESAKRVRAISPGGGTNLYPALLEAGAMLRDVEAQVKLIIALTDGVSMGTPAMGQNIASRLERDGVRISTIAVGDGADVDTLRSIALAGGGEHYRVVDPNLLPQIFIREVRVLRKPMVRETLFQPRIAPTGSPLIAGLPSPLPTLGGLVLTQPKGDATAINAIVAPGGEPVLAHWNIGLGRAAAWTSDSHRWARAWAEGGAFGTLWSSVARAIARPVSDQNFEVAVEAREGRVRVRLEAADDAGAPMDLLTVDGFVVAPSGDRREIRLTQIGPGVYEGEAAADETGAYVVALTPRLGGRRLPPVVAGAASAISPEHSRLESNIALLREIAETTGGRPLSWGFASPDELFARDGLAPRRATTPIWPMLLAWAVGVMLLDVGTRRVAWDRILSRELAAERGLAAAERSRGRASAATLGRLRSRGRRDDAGSPAPASAPSAPEPRRRITRPEESIPVADRREAIQRALRARKTGDRPEPAKPTKPAEGSTPAGSDSRADAAAGLFAAKKRARDRLDRESSAGD